jgi:hypothetical protein
VLLLMNDELTTKIEKLRLEAAECDLIAFLAEDRRKQAFFRKLASDLRMMAGDIEAAMPAASSVGRSPDAAPRRHG